MGIHPQQMTIHEQPSVCVAYTKSLIGFSSSGFENEEVKEVGQHFQNTVNRQGLPSDCNIPEMNFAEILSVYRVSNVLTKENPSKTQNSLTSLPLENNTF